MGENNGEKKGNKLGFSVFFLVFAIFAIILMEVLIYKLNLEKEKEFDELQNKVLSIEGTVIDLQEKMDKQMEKNDSTNTISNNTNTSTDSTNQSNDNNSISLTNEQVKKSLENYFELEQTMGISILDKLAQKGVLNYNDSDNLKHDYTVTTKVKFSEYKNAMLNFVSEKEFEKNWKTHGFEVDNNGYITSTGGYGGLLLYYDILSITKNDNNSYTVKTTYTEEHVQPSHDKTFTINVSLYNGKCVIDSIE